MHALSTTRNQLVDEETNKKRPGTTLILIDMVVVQATVAGSRGGRGVT